MRTTAHELFAHQPHGVVATGRHQTSSMRIRTFYRHLKQVGIRRMRHAICDRSTIHLAAADRFARFFAQRNSNGPFRSIAKSQDVVFGIFLERPTQLRGEPASQQQSRRTIPGREIDLHAFDFFEAMMRPRMIEELRERQPELPAAQSRSVHRPQTGGAIRKTGEGLRKFGERGQIFRREQDGPALEDFRLVQG